jgi:hypothetical protein
MGKGRGHMKFRLVMGRIQVKLAITRMELVAALNSVRFTKKERESLKMPINEVKYCTVLHRLVMHARQSANRVGQV